MCGRVEKRAEEQGVTSGVGWCVSREYMATAFLVLTVFATVVDKHGRHSESGLKVSVRRGEEGTKFDFEGMESLLVRDARLRFWSCCR